MHAYGHTFVIWRQLLHLRVELNVTTAGEYVQFLNKNFDERHK